ncbi:MAG TPA: FG-GAP-like repeat-containing protein, partial [Anaerolineae bacterium]|nr:FG-GAP-like repeat-containing protein [Anaerolineae bacterium]
MLSNHSAKYSRLILPVLWSSCFLLALFIATPSNTVASSLTAKKMGTITKQFSNQFGDNNTPPATFGHDIIYLNDIIDESQALDWGDWDNDGDLDLVTVNHDTIFIYENINNELILEPTLGHGWQINLPTPATDANWGDWDGDGDLDLAIATISLVADNSWPNYLYENDAGQALYLNPNEGWGWQSAEPAPSRALSWGDWDNDGDLDLAFGNATNEFTGFDDYIYENIGGTLSLTWQSPNAYPTFGLEWADFDNDNDLDLLFSYANNLPNELFENEAGLLLLGAGNGWTQPNSATTYGLDWGDWNNDQYLDIAFANSDGTQIYTNDQAGNFTLTTNDPYYETARAVHWGDWNGDGYIDLASVGDKHHRILENSNNLSFFPSWDLAVNYNVNDVHWTDWDSDGNLDLTVADENRNAIYANYNRLITANNLYPFNATPRDFAWGDWDNDGDLDLATANDAWGSSSVTVYENVNGQFFFDVLLGYGWTSTETASATRTAWGDWDNDGDLDLAVATGSPLESGGFHLTPQATSIADFNYVYENDAGSLHLDPANGLGWISPNSHDSSQVAWGDWDNDGDLDLAVSNRNNAPNYVYENIGGNLILDPTAGYGWQSTELSNTMDLAWGDWDNDSDLDLAIANNGQYNQVYENEDGNLYFDPDNGWGWQSPETYGSNALDWGDWDGDGDLDLAVGNDGSLTYIFENRNNSLEVEPTEGIGWASNSNLTIRDVTFFDWDGDGDLDLQTTGGFDFGNNGYIFENINQSKQFLYSTFDPKPANLMWADYDQDGDLDWGSAGVFDAGIYPNPHRSNNTTPSDLARIFVSQPNDIPAADGLATANFITNTIVPFTYTLTGHVAGHIQAEFSPNGGGYWLPAVAATGSITNTPPIGVPNIFYWDTFASGFFGQTDNMVLRLTVHPQPAIVSANGSYTYTLPHDTKWAYHSTQTHPFRLRGSRIRVIGNILDPEAYWSMDNISTTGELITEIDGLPNATPTGSPQITTDTPPTLFINQTAISFTAATNDGFTVADTPIINTASNYDYRTTSLWFKADNPATATGETLWEDGGHTNGFGLHLRDGDLHAGGWSDNRGWSSWISTTVAAEQWYHAVIVLDGIEGSFSLYLNGRLIQTNHNAGTMSFHAGNIGIGWTNDGTRIQATQYAGSSGLHYTGFIDDIRLFNTALTPDQVRQLFTSGLAQDTPVKDAFVFRIPAGQTIGSPINNLGNTLLTNAEGYLSGNGTIGVGDQLIALYPITTSAKYDVYYTSASPTTTGLNAHTVQAGGTQRLTVSPNNPLILYHLNISLEWDARQDGSYLQEL